MKACYRSRYIGGKSIIIRSTMGRFMWLNVIRATRVLTSTDCSVIFRSYPRILPPHTAQGPFNSNSPSNCCTQIVGLLPEPSANCATYLGFNGNSQGDIRWLTDFRNWCIHCILQLSRFGLAQNKCIYKYICKHIYRINFIF